MLGRLSTLALALTLASRAVGTCTEPKECSDYRAAFDALKLAGVNCQSRVLDAIDDEPTGEAKAKTQQYVDDGSIGKNDQVQDYCPKSCDICEKVVKAAIVLSVDFATINANAAAMSAFKTNFSTEMCDLVKRNASCITITSVRAGSTVVAFDVNVDPDGKEAPAVMLKDMTKAITAGDAKGFIGKSVLTVEPEKTFSAKANFTAIVVFVLFVILFVLCICPCCVCCVCCKRCWPFCCIRCCRGKDDVMNTEREDQMMKSLHMVP